MTSGPQTAPCPGTIVSARERDKPWEAPCPGPSVRGARMGAMPDTMQPAPLPSVYQLRVVVHGVSPLIWRRLLVRADTTIAGLHAVVQTAFGWDGEHLHPQLINGRGRGRRVVRHDAHPHAVQTRSGHGCPTGEPR